MHQAEGKRVILRKICRRDQQISFWSLQFCHGKCILSSKGVQRLELFGLYEKKEREFTDCNFRGKNILKQFEIVILAQPAPIFSRIEKKLAIMSFIQKMEDIVNICMRFYIFFNEDSYHMQC